MGFESNPAKGQFCEVTRKPYTYVHKCTRITSCANKLKSELLIALLLLLKLTILPVLKLLLKGLAPPNDREIGSF